MSFNQTTYLNTVSTLTSMGFKEISMPFNPPFTFSRELKFTEIEGTKEDYARIIAPQIRELVRGNGYTVSTFECLTSSDSPTFTVVIQFLP